MTGLGRVAASVAAPPPGAAALVSGLGLALGGPDSRTSRGAGRRAGRPRAELASRKRGAVRYFTTQLFGPDPILSAATIERLTRPYEVLIEP